MISAAGPTKQADPLAQHHGECAFQDLVPCRFPYVSDYDRRMSGSLFLLADAQTAAEAAHVLHKCVL